MKELGDVPLPGLEYALQPPTDVIAPRRSYSSTIPPTAATIERFWARVVRGPHCWIWTGAISGTDGYGRITWRVNGTSRTESTHRFALLIADQLQDGGGVGEHRCNEPLCVRVDEAHVIASTQSANLRYAIACGRAGATYPVGPRLDRHARSIAVREALRHGWDADAYAAASGSPGPLGDPPLF